MLSETQNPETEIAKSEGGEPAMVAWRASIKWMKPSSLKPLEDNPRKHSKKQINEIARAILEFGFYAPILIDEDNVIRAGHGRWLAANKLELARVPVIRRAGLTEAQKAALVIADNNIAANSSWDRLKLGAQLTKLNAGKFDVSLIAFPAEKLGRLMAPGADLTGDKPEKMPTITVTCESEAERDDLLERLVGEGFDCKAGKK